jgi:nitrogen regulatory protein PII
VFIGRSGRTQRSEVIMKFSYVIAIVPPETVDALERRFRSIGIGGMTLTKVKGFGEYKNFFSRDLLSEHTKLEVFVEESHLEGLLNALLEVAGSDVPGAGIAAVMPVERFLHLRTGTEFLPAPSV